MSFNLRLHRLYGVAVAAAALACLLLLLRWPAAAHEPQIRHQVVLQVEADALLAMVVYEVPAGPAASLLRAMFDPNRDGALDPDERAALAQKLSLDALHGLTFLRDDQPIAASALDWRLDVDPSRADGGLLLGLKIDLASHGPGRYTVQQTSFAAPTITLEADAVPPLAFSTALGLPAPDPLALGPWTLRPGDSLSFEVITSP
jgi:hypothetical protein